MSRLVKPRRGGAGAKRIDLTDLRDLLKDRRLWAQLAVVTRPDGADRHWELVSGQIHVDVRTVPRGIELHCRLGTQAGSVGQGLWRVPAEGTEVAVLVPDGMPDFQPIIVACLDSGPAPDRVGDDKTILVATDTVEITAPTVVLGPSPGSVISTWGVVNGEAIDPFTGLTQFALGNASRKVFGER